MEERHTDRDPITKCRHVNTGVRINNDTSTTDPGWEGKQPPWSSWVEPGVSSSPSPTGNRHCPGASQTESEP